MYGCETLESALELPNSILLLIRETKRNVKNFVFLSRRFGPLTAINAVAQFGPITEHYLRCLSMATRDNGRSANQLGPKSLFKSLPPELCNSIMFAIVRSSLKLFAICVVHRGKI